MFALWPGDWLNFSTFKPATFGYGGQTAASEAGHIANTNVAGQALRDRLPLTNRGEILTQVTVDFFLKMFVSVESSQQADNFAAARTGRGLFLLVFGDRTFSASGDSEQPLGHGAARNAVSKQDSEETSGTVDFFRTCDSNELM